MEAMAGALRATKTVANAPLSWRFAQTNEDVMGAQLFL